MTTTTTTTTTHASRPTMTTTDALTKLNELRDQRDSLANDLVTMPDHKYATKWHLDRQFEHAKVLRAIHILNEEMGW